MNNQQKTSAWRKFLHWTNNIPLVLRYGLILSFGLILIKTLEYQLFSYRFSFELYTGLLAVFFLLVGIATGLGWLHTHKKSAPQIPSLPDELLEPLTAKERELLKGLVAGRSNQQLADEHHVSINTIKTHLKNLYKKMSVSNRAQAVSRVKVLGLD